MDVEFRPQLDCLLITRRLFSRLLVKNDDVIFDLGSGIGQLVTFTSSYANVAKVYGIETCDVPADIAARISENFGRLMEFFEKVSSSFKLIKGDFTEPANKELIEKKANIIFANNWLFGDDLMGKLREILHLCAPGTDIVVTKLIDQTRFHKGTYLGHFNSFSHTGTLDSIDRPIEWSHKSFKFWVVKMDNDKDTECSQTNESFPEDPHHKARKEGKNERHEESRRAEESEKEGCSTLADNDVKL